MRVKTMMDRGDMDNAHQQQQFSDWLKRIGEGTEKIHQNHGPECIHIPDGMCIGCMPGDSVTSLLDSIYGNLNSIQDWNAKADYIVDRAILTPLNDDVDIINNYMGETYLKEKDGSPITMKSYLSADSLLQHEQTGTYPTEFLNNLSLSGIPPHELKLFVNCPVILLKNMTGGLANGTRLIITKVMTNILEAKVTTGPLKGNSVLIPRLNHTPSNVEKLPFTLQRRQFPIRPAFAMTINKSQGQTFQHIGIYLPNPVFSHGQLYVALSRVGKREGLKIMVVRKEGS